MIPLGPLAKRKIEIAGETVEYHALSRADCAKLKSFEENGAEGEQFILQRGLDLSTAEATEVYEGLSFEDASRLLEGITVLTGIRSQAQWDIDNARRKGLPITDEMLKAAGVSPS